MDAPHDPPCSRCKRESKECFFSATRRKRRAEDEAPEVGVVGDDDYTARNGRKRVAYQGRSHRTVRHDAGGALGLSSPSIDSREGSYDPNDSSTPGQPGPYYNDATESSTGDGHEQEIGNETAAALFKPPINTPNDAFNLLIQASAHTGDIDSQVANAKDAQRKLSPTNNRHAGAVDDQPVRHGRAHPLPNDTKNTNIDPILNSIPRSIQEPDPSAEALSAWSKLRFVRAGWFTAQEARDYVEYFYENLLPLIPVRPPDLRSRQAELLDEEPMLTVTILTIAARYKKLSGPGKEARTIMVHEKLWAYLQNMVTRMFWGQERYGGGFSGAARKPSGQRGLRSIGTVESLFLLSEFHPRSMHFPPGEVGYEVFALGEESTTATHPQQKESPFFDWTESVLRSDRMCWSLMGSAYTLSLELGIFGSFAEATKLGTTGSMQGNESPEHALRVERIKRLLYIYIVQTSGRLGFPSMLAESFQRHAQLNELHHSHGTLPSTDPIDMIQQSYVEVTSIMKECNVRLFPSKEETGRLIQTGNYIPILQDIHPMLFTWRERFDRMDLPESTSFVLLIEYEYARVYCNSLALQAVLEKWSSNAGLQDRDKQLHGPLAAQSFGDLYRRNAPYIREVVEASRNILVNVINGMWPNDLLKNNPVRTHFKILSGAVFLLKVSLTISLIPLGILHYLSSCLRERDSGTSCR